MAYSLASASWLSFGALKCDREAVADAVAAQRGPLGLQPSDRQLLLDSLTSLLEVL